MTEVVKRPAGALAISAGQTDWTPDQLAALDSLGIDDSVSKGDLGVFLTYAQRTGLDPFARQIYLIGRNSKEMVGKDQWRWRKRWSIQVGIDGFRVIATRTGKYRGQQGPRWCGPDGVWVEKWLAPEPPAAAWVAVLRADFDEPLTAVALLSEYGPRNDKDELMGLWNKMPALMLSKVAEALALRKAFPNDLSGVYVAEEMDQAGPAIEPGPNAPPRSVKDIADEAAAADPDGLRALWREAAVNSQLDIVVTDKPTGEVLPLRDFLTRCAERLAAPDQAAAEQGQADELSDEVERVRQERDRKLADDPWVKPAAAEETDDE